MTDSWRDDAAPGRSPTNDCARDFWGIGFSKNPGARPPSSIAPGAVARGPIADQVQRSVPARGDARRYSMAAVYRSSGRSRSADRIFVVSSRVRRRRIGVGARRLQSVRRRKGQPCNSSGCRLEHRQLCWSLVPAAGAKTMPHITFAACVAPRCAGLRNPLLRSRDFPLIHPEGSLSWVSTILVTRPTIF